jgi:hypothetical protein
MSAKFKSNVLVSATLLLSTMLLSSGTIQASTGECVIAQARVGAAISQYQQECLRYNNGQPVLICSNDRLTYHYNRVNRLTAIARRVCAGY